MSYFGDEYIQKQQYQSQALPVKSADFLPNVAPANYLNL
jgi:hypothetical protein